MPKHLVVLAALVVASHVAAAQAGTPEPRAVVRIRLTDVKGNPIWDASSSWKMSDDREWTFAGHSDRDGRFQISARAGKVIIHSYAIGFDFGSDTVRVTAGDTVVRQIIMRLNRWGPLSGLHFAGAAGASVSLGPAYLTGIDGSRPNRDHGLAFALVEPGYKAGRISAGYVTGGNLGSGLALRGTLLRKWKGTSQSFVGAELTAMPFFLLGARVGVFRRIQGGNGMFVFVDFGAGV